MQKYAQAHFIALFFLFFFFMQQVGCWSQLYPLKNL